MARTRFEHQRNAESCWIEQTDSKQRRGFHWSIRMVAKLKPQGLSIAQCYTPFSGSWCQLCYLHLLRLVTGATPVNWFQFQRNEVSSETISDTFAHDFMQDCGAKSARDLWFARQSNCGGSKTSFIQNMYTVYSKYVRHFWYHTNSRSMPFFISCKHSWGWPSHAPSISRYLLSSVPMFLLFSKGASSRSDQSQT